MRRACARVCAKTAAFLVQVVLQKRQQEAAKRHREYEQKMSREIQVQQCMRHHELIRDTEDTS